MSERVLFVPSWVISPAAAEEIPGVRSLLDDLRVHFDVRLFSWPWMSSSDRDDCSWEGVVSALRDEVADGDHLLVMGAGTASTLLAASSPRQPASFIAAGMVTPPATLHALGHSELANIFVSAWEGGSSYQYTRLVMEGAAEDLWDRYARLMDEGTDWPRFLANVDSFRQVNLLQEKPDLRAPALYLESPLRVAGYTEQRESFRRLVPQAEVEYLEVWPGQLHETQSGRDLSQKAIPFVERHAAS